MNNCINCSFQVELNYCPNCGQEVHIHKINKSFILHDLQHGFLHFDLGFFYTITQLIKKPAFVINDFINGKRKSYTNPFTLLLFLTTLYSLLSIDVYKSKALEKSQDTFEKLIQYLFSHQTIFILIIIPLTALITYKLFKKSNYSYYEIIVFECFIQSIVVVINLVEYTINYFFPSISYLWIIKVLLMIFINIKARLMFINSYNLSQILIRTALSYVLNYIILFIFFAIIGIFVYTFE